MAIFWLFEQNFDVLNQTKLKSGFLTTTSILTAMRKYLILTKTYGTTPFPLFNGKLNFYWLQRDSNQQPLSS